MLYIWLCCLVEAHLIMLVISVAAGMAVGGVGGGGVGVAPLAGWSTNALKWQQLT